ncbi:MAG: hypothetical protein V2A61_05390 [Calditrichota bacterium]
MKITFPALEGGLQPALVELEAQPTRELEMVIFKRTTTGQERDKLGPSE